MHPQGFLSVGIATLLWPGLMALAQEKAPLPPDSPIAESQPDTAPTEPAQPPPAKAEVPPPKKKSYYVAPKGNAVN